MSDYELSTNETEFQRRKRSQNNQEKPATIKFSQESDHVTKNKLDTTITSNIPSEGLNEETAPLLGKKYPIVLDDAELSNNSVLWLQHPLPVVRFIVGLPAGTKFDIDLIGCEFNITHGVGAFEDVLGTNVECYKNPGDMGLDTCPLPRCKPPSESYNLQCIDNCNNYAGTTATYTCYPGYSVNPTMTTQEQTMGCYSDLTTNSTLLQPCWRKFIPQRTGYITII